MQSFIVVWQGKISYWGKFLRVILYFLGIFLESLTFDIQKILLFQFAYVLFASLMTNQQFHYPYFLYNLYSGQSMGEKSTIESLISTSGEDDFEGIPLFYQGKIVKRISKEEIQGWTQNHHSQPFHKKEIDSRKKNLVKQHKKIKGQSEKFQDEEWASQPTLEMIKKQLKDYGETKDMFQAFRTFSQLPQIAQDSALPKTAQPKQPKQDFIKGIRFQNCNAIYRKTVTLKPLSKPPSINCEKITRIRSRSVSMNKNRKKRQSLENKVSIISYPLDFTLNEDSFTHSTQNKLHIYMRKYQI